MQNSLFMSKGYNHNRKSVPENKSLNLSSSLGNDKKESNYFRNCNNTYYIHGQSNVNQPTSKENRSKEKLTGKYMLGYLESKSSKRKPSNQGCLLSVNPVVIPATLGSKIKPRSRSKEDLKTIDPRISSLIGGSMNLTKKVRKTETGS